MHPHTDCRPYDGTVAQAQGVRIVSPNPCRALAAATFIGASLISGCASTTESESGNPTTPAASTAATSATASRPGKSPSPRPAAESASASPSAIARQCSAEQLKALRIREAKTGGPYSIGDVSIDVTDENWASFELTVDAMSDGTPDHGVAVCASTGQWRLVALGRVDVPPPVTLGCDTGAPASLLANLGSNCSAPATEAPASPPPPPGNYAVTFDLRTGRTGTFSQPVPARQTAGGWIVTLDVTISNQSGRTATAQHGDFFVDLTSGGNASSLVSLNGYTLKPGRHELPDAAEHLYGIDLPDGRSATDTYELRFKTLGPRLTVTFDPCGVISVSPCFGTLQTVGLDTLR